MAVVLQASLAINGSSLSFTRSRRNVSLQPRMAVGSDSSLSSATPILTKLQKECATPLPILRHVADAMANDMRAGLAFDGGSDLKMILSYVDSLPTGEDQRAIAIESKQVSIPQELMFGTSEIISTEWGAFSTGLPLTDFDREMDAASINPGEQIFEKTISGMYLGEIVRRVLLRMAEVGLLFGSSIPEKLQTPFSLSTPHICAMQQDKSGNLEAVGSVLYNEAGVESNSKAREIVLKVCDTIVKQGGRLAGAGIVGVLQKTEEDTKGLIFGKRTVVEMDGGLYEKYPQYRRHLQDAVTELLGPELSQNLVIEHSKDGSGIGAALLAAANSKYRHDT